MTNTRTNAERSPESHQIGETPTHTQGDTEDESSPQQQSLPESREETVPSTNSHNHETSQQQQQQQRGVQQEQQQQQRETQQSQQEQQQQQREAQQSQQEPQQQQREAQQSQQEQQPPSLLQVRSQQQVHEQRQDRSPQRHRQRQSPSPHGHSRRSEHYQPTEPHQQASTVLVVQQPIILGRGAYVRRGHPFMYRGVHLGNDSKIGMNCLLTLGVGGGTLVVMGAVYGVDKMEGFFLVLTGSILVATTLRLCYKAKQDFDALPQDHPDRVTYSSPIVLTREAREIASTTTTYQLPPGAQVINTSPIHGTHMVPTYQLPAGAQVISSTSTLGPRLAPPAILQPSGAVATSGTRAFDYEDKPPSYDEVCKNFR